MNDLEAAEILEKAMPAIMFFNAGIKEAVEHAAKRLREISASPYGYKVAENTKLQQELHEIAMRERRDMSDG